MGREEFLYVTNLDFTYLFTCDVVGASLDFTECALANIFAYHVVTDAPTLLHRFLVGIHRHGLEEPIVIGGAHLCRLIVRCRVWLGLLCFAIVGGCCRGVVG